MQCLRHVYAKKLLVVYLKFKFKWSPVFFSETLLLPCLKEPDSDVRGSSNGECRVLRAYFIKVEQRVEAEVR